MIAIISILIIYIIFKTENKIKNSDSLVSAVDVMQKFVAIASNKETIELPKQAAYIMYEMLGRKNKLNKDLWFNIEQWSGFQAIHDKYKYTNLDDTIQDYMDLTPEEMGKANNELERGINPFAKSVIFLIPSSGKLPFLNSANTSGCLFSNSNKNCTSNAFTFLTATSFNNPCVPK